MTIASASAHTIDYAKDGFPPLQAPITPMTTPKYQRFNKEKTPTFSKLNRLERKIFNQVYENDTPKNRISRLEEQIFGTIQNGDLNNRYMVLQKAVPKYLSQTTTQDFSPYCGTPMTNWNNWRGLAGSLGSFFTGGYSGYPTGISPQISMPNFYNTNPDFQRANFSNRSWDIHNQSIGTGSRVQILD